ncbi:annexin A7 isoform X2 isoform B [Micractinium conductrix]|uniref:Annexin A7 isoform X2 isoform A n=1 Tax=Micractinium conductrix TaxID=554055 RepID=A0A2P6UZN9_9CHLO|nr:annexin A7 isoform X2 isoform A [Micractinium conductrix]PSC67315.1 annexin A7 isoform X2 isoform B [Micractinium conductrix]|eukprot:PSC67314.1 annexin A7 isoform X2 isoform A [Micractinium conductrix]
MARSARGQGNPYGVLYMLLSLLSVGLCVAILIIVNQYLWYGSYCYWLYVGGNQIYTCLSYNRCYMQTEDSQGDINVCYFSWSAGAIGIFFALCVFFFQVCSGRNRHLPTCEVLVCMMSLMWWIGVAVTTMIYSQNADDVPVVPGINGQETDSMVLEDKTDWRTSVWAMAWANVGLWALCLLASLKDCCSVKKQAPAEPQYPAGAYAQPVQQNVYYAAPATGGAPAYYAALPGAGYPPAGQPAGYPPAGQQPSPFAATPAAPAGYPPQ